MFKENNIEQNNKFEALEKLNLESHSKAFILLIILGLKPAVEFRLETWNSSPEEIMETVKKYGLATDYVVKNSGILGDVPLIEVAKDQETLDQLRRLTSWSDNSEEQRAYGILAGYPETAVNAFISKDLAGDEFDAQRPSGMEYGYLSFKPSREHFKEDTRHYEMWKDAVKKNSPKIYKDLFINLNA